MVTPTHWARFGAHSNVSSLLMAFEECTPPTGTWKEEGWGGLGPEKCLSREIPTPYDHRDHGLLPQQVAPVNPITDVWVEACQVS